MLTPVLTPVLAPMVAPMVAPFVATLAAQPARDTLRTVGERDAFAARIVGVAYAPSRATYELGRPAYVTIVSVTDKAIQAILPARGVKQRIEGAGVRVASLSRQADSAANGVADRFRGAGAPVVEDDVSAAALMEYNRCLANARQADARQRAASRKVIGYNKDGSPIYGPPDEPIREAESYCRPPSAGRARTAGPPAPAQPGRYLLLYASDTPIEFRDIEELSVSEGDPRSIAEVIGKKLFGIRGARWSGSFIPW